PGVAGRAGLEWAAAGALGLGVGNWFGAGQRFRIHPVPSNLAMCRPVWLCGRPPRVGARCWVVAAPAWPGAQEARRAHAAGGRREADGTGVGWLDAPGQPLVYKQPVAAYEDQEFAQEARDLCSRAFIAHIRYASTGAIPPQNTHPFEQRDRLFAHNGVIEDLP